MINGRDAHSPLPLLPPPTHPWAMEEAEALIRPKRRPEEKRKSAQAPIDIYFRVLRFVLWAAVKGRFLFCGCCLGTAEVRKSRKPPPRNSLWFGTAPFLSPFPFSLTTIDERLSLGQKKGGEDGRESLRKRGRGEKQGTNDTEWGRAKGERSKKEKLLLFRLCRKRRNFFLPLPFLDCI